MPIKDMTLGPGFLRLHDDINTTIKVDEILSLSEEDYVESIDSPAFTLTKTASFTFEGESAINESLLNELAGLPTNPQPTFYMEHEGTRLEQIRKHKKKRINKKWAKRYGYREVPCRYRYGRCHISEDATDEIVVDCDSITVEDI